VEDTYLSQSHVGTHIDGWVTSASGVAITIRRRWESHQNYIKTSLKPRLRHARRIIDMVG
jgi:hypothetical protein